MKQLRAVTGDGLITDHQNIAHFLLGKSNMITKSLAEATKHQNPNMPEALYCCCHINKY